MMTTRTKAALIRDPSVPVGQPGPCHVRCDCGRDVPIATRPTGYPDTSQRNVCPCGTVYAADGWILGSDAAVRATMRTTGRTCSQHPCRSDAVGVLHAPDGTVVPGGAVCWPHGTACVLEYAAKLGEVWTVAPLAML
jgi:hypothetical protein